MEVKVEIDVNKEKDLAKTMLKAVEQGLEEQKIKKERKNPTLGGAAISPSLNWNKLRKQIKEEDEKRKKGQVEKTDQEAEGKKKKNKKKRQQKEAAKANEGKQGEVSGGSIVDQVFFPEKHDKSKGMTPIVALDCEMVEVDHTSDALARISIVNYNGHILLDTFVKPKGTITNYRSWVSGVYPHSMKTAIPYDEVREKAIEIMKDKVIVGHSLKHDFKVLNWEPMQHNVRDLITFKRFQDEGKHPKSLKKLTLEFLEKHIQTAAHSSVVDARAALGCYRVVENSWNQQVRSKQQKIKWARVEAETTLLGKIKKRRKRSE